MIQTARTIEQAAERIERAYLLRRPEWRHVGLDRRLWAAAASVLVDACHRDPGVPLDPELFVACQIAAAAESNPWSELTHAASRRQYIREVRRITRILRDELRQELRKIAAALRSGRTPDSVLLAPRSGLTPLARYLAAFRAGRPDLAAQLRPDARDQHFACPLYRRAALGLVPEASYPVSDLFLEIVPPPAIRDGSQN